jgi:hypothetical protein
VDTSDLQLGAPAKSANGFRYLRDPVFVVSVLLYGTNRWVLKSHVGGWFIHDYLNDVLCLPLFLPFILKTQAVLGIRRHDEMPTALEVLHNWIVFSVVFELVLPRLSMFASAADPWDSFAYLLGGFAAYAYWHSPAEFVHAARTALASAATCTTRSTQ